MRIEIVSLFAGGSDEISVGFELFEGENICRERFLIPTEVYIGLSLSKGECDREVYDAVEKEGQIYAAYKRGLYILGYGACSKNMLVSKLIAKGVDRTAAKEAVERICARGFVNEPESARREAEICVSKLWGVSRIRAHLMQKKYAAEAIDEALFAMEDAGVDFDENCKKAISVKYKRIPTDRAEMQKLVAAVCRLGYSVSQIKSACIALQEERKWDIYSS